MILININLRLKAPDPDDVTDDEIERTRKVLEIIGEIMLADGVFLDIMEKAWEKST